MKLHFIAEQNADHEPKWTVWAFTSIEAQEASLRDSTRRAITLNEIPTYLEYWSPSQGKLIRPNKRRLEFWGVLTTQNSFGAIGKVGIATKETYNLIRTLFSS